MLFGLLVCLFVFESVSLCSPGWPGIQRSSCICLPSTEIKGMHYHTSENTLFYSHHFRDKAERDKDLIPSSLPPAHALTSLDSVIKMACISPRLHEQMLGFSCNFRPSAQHPLALSGSLVSLTKVTLWVFGIKSELI